MDQEQLILIPPSFMQPCTEQGAQSKTLQPLAPTDTNAESI